MNIHEYQAKAVLAKYGVAVPKGGVAFTPEEAEKVARDVAGPPWVVKAQIHAGGRGMGGGIKFVQSVEDVVAAANDLLGMTLVTPQTGPAGKEVRRIYIEEGCDIARELYLGLLVDRATSGLVMMASTEGGMEIEEVAKQTPEKILTVGIDSASACSPSTPASSPSASASKASSSTPPSSCCSACTRRFSRPTPAWLRSTRWW